jgi:tripartite-type tricarboxylate transporter receptor subunit TctC
MAVTTAERMPAEPGIPTLAESGLAGYEVILWHGIAGPKGLPRAIVDRINAEVSAIVKLKDTAEQLQTDGVSPISSTPDELQATIRKEIEMWRKVIHDSGITLQ